MSTSVARGGVWGVVEEKLGGPAPEDRGIWDRLETLVDQGEYRPKIADDLEVKKFDRRSGEPYYMVANPRDLVHYRLEAADYELLGYMDGTRTVKEIVVDRLREGGEIDVGGVADLVYTLYIENFLEDRYVDVDAMVKQAVDPKLRRHRLRRFASTLTVEWRGAQRPVQWLHDHGLKWALTTPFVVLSAFLALAGMVAFAANVESKRFTLTGGSLAIGFLILLIIDYFMVMVHELGHALVLVHNGRKLKGAGFTIYFGVPAFYVDSSDGLMMERRPRILQAFAGPYAQSLGAGAAAILAWAFPQWAVSTTLYRYTVLAYLNIFLNAIPLLELDGYWMLSDYLRIPDLRPRSLDFLRHDLFRKIRERERLTRQQVGLLIYAIAGILASGLLFISGYIFFKVVFKNLVISLWNGGIYTRIILIALGLFLLNPLIRGAVNLARALARRFRALSRRIRFRLQRKWRVEAAGLIDSLPLFADLDEEVLSDLAGRVRLRTFPKGQTIVRQGERAEAFYVVRRGTARVVEEDPDNGTEIRTLRVLGRGEAFGEVGLAEAARRSATVRAEEDTELFEIDKGTFDTLLADTLRAPDFAPTIQAVVELGKLPSFSHLEPDELAELLAYGDWQNVAPGEAIVEQGQVGDAFFALSSGQVDVFENGTKVRTLGAGGHFGEIALLLDVPRTATVRALTPVRAFRLEREGFDKLVKDSFRKGTLNPAVSLDRVWDH
jgi:putative peptide zinc metalloprotease protein